MVSPVLNEPYWPGGFMVSQAPGALSFDTGTIANAGTVDLTLQGGLVLSRAAGTTAAAAGVKNTGNGTVGSITAGAAVQIGVYTLIATAATTFDVVDPDGVNLGTATAGTGFTSQELNLTVTAGGTAFVAGDTFTINVPGANYASYTGAADLPATAILYGLETIPASGSKVVTVVSRNAEVNKAELQWDAAIVNATSAAAVQTAALGELLTKGIVAR
jgi:hypothetical protein